MTWNMCSLNRHSPQSWRRHHQTYYNLSRVNGQVLFSRSLLSFDLNGDGNDDLVLGAPLHGQPGNPMAGRVYVKYGTAIITQDSNSVIWLFV